MTVSSAPGGTTPVADVHTHGNSGGKDLSFSDNNFSSKVMSRNIASGMDGYVATSDG